MRYVAARFTKEEWDRLVDAVMEKRGDMRIMDVFRESLSAMSEEDLLALEVREVGGIGGVVVKATLIGEELHRKVKAVAKKRGVEISRLVAEAVLRYWL